MFSEEEIEDAAEYVGVEPERLAEALRYIMHKRKWAAEQQAKGSGND